MSKWHDLGPVEDFNKQPLTEARVKALKFAISWQNGQFGAVSPTFADFE